MSIDLLKDIIITESDIDWIENVMGNTIHFDHDRREIIKCLDSIDIQAFPGSGKTTLLVAKLAILAKKWSFSNKGICVLSHTNVAREVFLEEYMIIGMNMTQIKVNITPHDCL